MEGGGGQVLRTGFAAERPKPWPGGEDVEFGGDVEFVAGFEEEDGVFDGDDAVGGGVEEEDGGRVFGDAFFSGEEGGGEFVVGADEAQAAAFVGDGRVVEVDDGVEEDGEGSGRARRKSIASEVRGWERRCLWRRGRRGCRRQENLHDADTVGIDVVLGMRWCGRCGWRLGVLEGMNLL